MFSFFKKKPADHPKVQPDKYEYVCECGIASSKSLEMIKAHCTYGHEEPHGYHVRDVKDKVVKE